MNRFAFNGDINKLKTEKFDVVIIGSGIAGLYTALNLDNKLSVAVLSKESSMICSSWLAQGGIAVVTNSSDDETYHIKDTLVAGAGLCDLEAVITLVNKGPNEINRLIGMGVSFDVKDDGNLETTREGGHSMNRILHSGGDATGKELTKKLAFLATKSENLTLRADIFLVDILTYNNKAFGVIIFEDEYKLILSSNIVICTGGIGQVYKYTTNPTVSTGDGVATASRAGAILSDMEFVQFHPTAFYDENVKGQSFLISEALRGEGAILRDINGAKFMQGIHPLADLAPRDIVARAIVAQMKKTDAPNVLLDITHKGEGFLKDRFPTIYEECKNRGINISKEYIPVVPVQHYMMGGIKTNLNAMTNIDGLYACGESACTGVHGANRLASNSLLECIVFGRLCAEHIMKKKRQTPKIDLNLVYYNTEKKLSKINISEIKAKIKEIMSEKGGIIRSTNKLAQGIDELYDIINLLNNILLQNPSQIETLNMAQTASFILIAAYNRNESVGAHFREN